MWYFANSPALPPFEMVVVGCQIVRYIFLSSLFYKLFAPADFADDADNLV